MLSRPVVRSTRQLGARTARPTRIAAVTITTPQGREVVADKERFVIGSGSQCDLVVSGKNVFPEHACLQQRGQQVFCSALNQVGESILDAQTFTWLDGVQLRKGPSYILATGSEIAIGDEGQKYTVQFKQASGGNPMLEMVIKAMTSSASEDVKKIVDENLGNK